MAGSANGPGPVATSETPGRAQNPAAADWLLLVSGLLCWSSHACAASKRFQPGKVAARLTSRHLKWRGGFWNSAIFGKKTSTNRWTREWRSRLVFGQLYAIRTAPT